jgi:cobalt-zinc-cadmium efflux system outer membrane protein
MRRLTRLRLLACLLGAGAAGCAGRPVRLPAGHLPAAVGPLDRRTAADLGPTRAPPPAPAAGPAAAPPFDLPRSLPGADTPPITPPRFNRDTPAEERQRAVRAAYPEVTPVAAVAPLDGEPLTLADLQKMATENSPVLRRAVANADAQYGQVIQAGLAPNPTVGYQADQVQPSIRPDALPRPGSSGAGQQGGYVNWLVKTAGKLRLAQLVSGFDYLNALVAVRRAEVDVATAVRTQYFALLVARQAVDVNRTVATLADEVYRLQLRQVAVGEAAGYEPLLLYSQAEQARNALAQSEATARAAWRQLAAAVGRPDLPPAPLAGRADAAAPVFDPAAVEARVLDQHTDLMTARNTVAQAQVNLTLQRRTPIPDIATNQYHQYDNAAQTYQFGLQFGLALPILDRNQGNIRTAQYQIARATADLEATRNDLLGRLAEALARFDANRAVAERYRAKVLPNLSAAYRAIVRRYQVEPEKVGFNDIVVAQGSLVTALQGYLTALDAQWRAAADVANVGQLDELYGPPADGGGAACPVPAAGPPVLPAPLPVPAPPPAPAPAPPRAAAPPDGPIKPAAAVEWRPASPGPGE